MTNNQLVKTATTDNQAPITRLYRDILNREPSLRELTNIERFIAQAGNSLNTVQIQLANGSDATAQIEVAYRDILGRASDPSGLAHFKHVLAQSDGSLSVVRGHLATSVEAAAKATSLYQDVLDRLPGPDELMALQVMLVKPGNSLSAFRVELSETPEAVDKANEIFQNLFVENPESDSILNFRRALGQHGSSLKSLRVQLASTAEYAAHVSEVFRDAVGREISPNAMANIQRILAKKGGSLTAIINALVANTVLAEQPSEQDPHVMSICSRLTELEAKYAPTIAYLPPLLEQVSTLKAFGFRLKRLNAAITDAVARSDRDLEKIEQLESRLSETNRQLLQMQYILRDQADVIKATHGRGDQLVSTSSANSPRWEDAVDASLTFDKHDAGILRPLVTIGSEINNLLHKILLVSSGLPEATAALASKFDIRSIERRLENSFNNTLTPCGNLEGQIDRIFEQIRALDGWADYALRSLHGGTETEPAGVKTEKDIRFEGRKIAHLPVTIRNLDKITAARNTGLKLNVGCGRSPKEGYVNVDRRDLPAVDITAEADALPFEFGELTAIHLAYLSNHRPVQHSRDKILSYWHDLLAPGGRLTMVLPDVEALFEHIRDGQYDLVAFQNLLVALTDNSLPLEDGFLIPSSLENLLIEVGYKDIEIRTREHNSEMYYEFEIVASKSN